MAYFPNKTSGDGIWKLRDFSKYIQANNFPGIGNAIFGFGLVTGVVNTITRFDNTGAYVDEPTITATARYNLAAASYGGDKAIFGFGDDTTGNVNTVIRFNNNGDYVDEPTTAATARYYLAAASYG